MNKKKVIITILKWIATVATSIATALATTSCMR